MLKLDSSTPSNMATTDTAQTVSGAKEYTCNAGSVTTSAAAGVLGAVSGFPGVWVLGGSQTPSTSNYAILNAGDTCFNTATGTTLRLRAANANLLSLTTSLATFAAGIKAVFDATDASGTPGNATINKPSGQVAVASGVSSVTVSNSLVSSTSVVLAVLQDNTDAVEIRSVVPGSNTFTINLTGVTSAARKVGFVVFN